ncbi:PD40 domain-containing protein [Neolewinella antarctica]|uniref:Tetratricopeptide (TPR) repeat protein n=1 Tax=Neolewinella antarctica TaxID=442734 RepID=A0ABX0XEQ1_9BACT|nr:PD40 domain-containing protein [Neolewinella antarctica]NJC27721.1 tetratricopeptide (TPR) repeat protein [Neolewinella antarctica]
MRLLFILLILPNLLCGQDRSRLESARLQYAAGEYAAVVQTLRLGRGLAKEDTEAALLLAVSLFHVNDLTAAKTELDNLIARGGGDLPLARFYRGRVYHAQNLFTEAMVEYKKFARTLDQSGETWLTITTLLRNVDNGLRASGGTEQILVDNLGPAVNTPGDEFGPIPSPSGNGRVYFTAHSSGLGGPEGNTDILVTSASGDGWVSRTSLNPLLNTPLNENLVDISQNGNRLYYFRGETMMNGDYLVDTFRQDNTTELVTLAVEVPFSGRTRDVTPFFSADDAVYFASDRPDGYGGLDLYRRERLADGTFGPSTNLGPTVNGPYDEICPFVARNGRTLYFSTNDPEFSIGGFDVVKSFRVINGDGQFTLPENVGLPINSAGDDTHFRLAPDTFTGFLASDRKDGYGQRDIYAIYYPTARLEMQ